MIIPQIREQTRDYAAEVLRRFRADHPDAVFTALAIECPYEGDLHFYIGTGEPDDDPDGWDHTLVEQEVGDIAPPAWISEFIALQERDFFAELPQARRDVLRGTADPDGDSAVADLLALPPLYDGAEENPRQPLFVLFEKPGHGDGKLAEAMPQLLSPSFRELATAHFRCRRANVAAPEHAPLRGKYRAGQHQMAAFSRFGRSLGTRVLTAGDVDRLEETLRGMIERSGITEAEWQAREDAGRRHAAEVRETHGTILEAVADAAVDVERGGLLQECGFAPDAVLTVFWSDEAPEAGRERIETRRSR